MYIANNETAVSSKGILNYMPQGYGDICTA